MADKLSNTLSDHIATLSDNSPKWTNFNATTSASGNVRSDIRVVYDGKWRYVVACVCYEDNSWVPRSDVSITPVQYTENGNAYVGFQIKSIVSPYSPVANTAFRIGFGYIERT